MKTHIEKKNAIQEIRRHNKECLIVLKEGFECNGARVIRGATENECFEMFNASLEFVHKGVHYKPWLKSQFHHVYKNLDTHWLACIYYTHKPLKQYALFTLDGRIYYVRSGRHFDRIFKARQREYMARNAQNEKVGELLELTTKFKYSLSSHYNPFIRLVCKTKGGYKCYYSEGYISLQKSDDLDKCKNYVVGKDLAELKRNVKRYAPVPVKVVDGRVKVVSDISEKEIRSAESFYLDKNFGSFKHCKEVIWTRFGVYIEFEAPYKSYQRTLNPFEGESKAVMPRSNVLQFLGKKWLCQNEKGVHLFNSDLYRGFIGVQEKYVKTIGQYFNLEDVDDVHNALCFVELKEGFASDYLGKPAQKAFLQDIEEVCGFCAKQYIRKKG